MISVAEHRKSHIRIFDKQMAFVDIGPPAGETVLFLHGNPTSSYLWRNIMPHLADTCRCLAPDLIGMGDSEKLTDPGPENYTFWDHYGFLEAWIDPVVPDGLVTLVVNDWGSALGFHWASSHRDRVRGIAERGAKRRYPAALPLSPKGGPSRMTHRAGVWCPVYEARGNCRFELKKDKN